MRERGIKLASLPAAIIVGALFTENLLMLSVGVAGAVLSPLLQWAIRTRERELWDGLTTAPGFRTASFAALLLGPKFGRTADGIRADVVAEWTEAEAAGDRRLVRWLRVRTSVVIISNAVVYAVRLPLDLALKVKQLFFG